MSDSTGQSASISPDSRVDAGTVIRGPVTFGRWASAEGSAIAVATAEGRCSLIGTSLSGGAVEDVRAIDSALTGTTARFSALNGVSAAECDLSSSKISGPRDDEGSLHLRLEGSQISHSLLRHGGRQGSLRVRDSVLAATSLVGHGELRDSTLLATTLLGRVAVHQCLCAPAHYRPDTTQTLPSGADLNQILRRLDALPGQNEWDWPAHVEDSCRIDDSARPRITDSTITGSHISGTVTGSRVDGSHIIGTVAWSTVSHSHISATGSVRDSAQVTSATIHGTVAGGSVHGAVVPETAFVGPTAEILADSHIAVAEIDGIPHTAYRTMEDGVVVVGPSGQSVDLGHGSAADLALQVSRGFDPLVDTSIDLGLDPGPNDQPLLP